MSKRFRRAKDTLKSMKITNRDIRRFIHEKEQDFKIYKRRVDQVRSIQKKIGPHQG